MKKHIPILSFLIALIISLFTVLSVWLKPDFVKSNGEIVSYNVPNEVLIAIVGLIIIGGLYFWNKRIWRITFTLFLVISLSPFLNFSSTTMNFGIGILSFDLLSSILLIIHLSVNPEWKGYLNKSEEKLKKERLKEEEFFNQKVSKFEIKFDSKSTKELEQIIYQGVFAEEAVMAAQNLLKSKTSYNKK